MRNYLLLIVVLIAYCTNAQTYTQDWRQCNLKEGGVLTRTQKSAIDAAGNIIETGFLHPDTYGEGTDSVYIKKYNTNGHLLWTIYSKYEYSRRIYTGTLSDVQIAVDNTGNVYISYPTLTDSSHYSLATLKYNSKGLLQWMNIFDSNERKDNKQPIKINVTAEGVVYITAAVFKTDYSKTYSYVIAYNKSGQSLWSTTINGINDDEKKLGCTAADATIDSAGNVYITGYSYLVRDNDHYGQFVAVSKIGADGTIIWLKDYGFNGDHFIPNVIRYSAYNNSVVVGGYGGFVTYYMLLLNYDAQGTLRWVNRDEKVKGIYDEVIDSNGNIITGALLTDAGKVYNGTPGICSFLANGSITGQHSAFNNGYFYSNYRVFNLTADKQQHYYLFCEGSNPLHYDLLIQKYNTTGKRLSEIKITATDSVHLFYLYSANLNVDDLQNIFVSTNAEATYQSQGGYYDCISKYSLAQVITNERKTAIQSNTTAISSIIYPNPATDKLYIKTTGRATFILCSMEGQLLIKQVINGNGIITLTNLLPGVYFLKNPADNTARKIIVVK